MARHQPTGRGPASIDTLRMSHEAMSEIPPGYEATRRTPEFTEATVPDKLRAAHSTAEGVWALIHVTEGRLRYRVVDPAEPSEVVLEPDAPPGVIKPAQLHEVEPLGAVRFSVEFYRRATTGGR